MSQSCIFCRIVAGELPSHRVGENEGAYAFLDIQPLVEGHTMVIPTRHVEHLEDLDDSEVAAVFALAREVSRAQRQSLGAAATTVGINNGAAAGQVVGHVHVHVLPRYDGDNGGSVHSVVRGPSTTALEEVARRLAGAVP